MSDTSSTVKMKVSKFMQMWSGLLALSGRTLSGLDSETSVALLLKAYEPVHEVIHKKQKAAEEKHLARRGDKVVRVDRLGLQKKLDAIDDLLITVKLPVKLLSKADLPVSSDTDDDAKNRIAISAILPMLGPLYDWRHDKVSQDLVTPVDQDLEGQLDALISEAPVVSAPVKV